MDRTRGAAWLRLTLPEPLRRNVNVERRAEGDPDRPRHRHAMPQEVDRVSDGIRGVLPRSDHCRCEVGLEKGVSQTFAWPPPSLPTTGSGETSQGQR